MAGEVMDTKQTKFVEEIIERVERYKSVKEESLQIHVQFLKDITLMYLV